MTDRVGVASLTASLCSPALAVVPSCGCHYYDTLWWLHIAYRAVT